MILEMAGYLINDALLGQIFRIYEITEHFKKEGKEYFYLDHYIVKNPPPNNIIKHEIKTLNHVVYPSNFNYLFKTLL